MPDTLLAYQRPLPTGDRNDLGWEDREVLEAVFVMDGRLVVGLSHVSVILCGLLLVSLVCELFVSLVRFVVCDYAFCLLALEVFVVCL